MYALHDDTIFRAPVARALPLFRRIVKLYKELGLEVNEDKTEVLFRGNIRNIDAVQGLAGLTQITQKISNSGMVFGGIPFGYDKYVVDYATSKINDHEALADRLIANSTEHNVGSVFSIVRFCLS